MALTLSLGLAAGVFQLVRNHKAVGQEQDERLQAQAVVVTENIIRQLDGVANALTGLRTEIFLARERGDTTIPTLSIQTLVAAMPGVVGISIFDANGVVVASDKSELVGRNFFERPYFQIARRGNTMANLYVSPPYRSSRGTYSVNLSKSIADANGDFIGVVTANLDPEYFSLVATSVLYARDMVVNVAHGSGQVFVDARLGQRVDPNERQSAHAEVATRIAAGQGAPSDRRFTDADGEEKMLAVRSILPPSLHMDFPLTVAVSRNVADVYRPWFKDFKLYALSYALLALGATVAVCLMQLRQKALLRAMAIEAEHERQTQIAQGLQTANAELERLTVTDGLTGVGNRRMFENTLASEWARCGRARVPLSALLVDVDHFKQFNDRYGHAVGDTVLVQVAGALAKAARRSGEIVARYGGEEFVVLLPATDLDKAQAVAEECLRCVRAAKIIHGGSRVSEYVSVSIGVASAMPGVESSAAELIKDADQAMYAAKKQGRNRVAVAGQGVGLKVES